MKYLILFIFLFTIYFSTAWFCQFYILGEGRYVNTKTQDKYLRNIDKFYAISDDLIKSNYKHDDSLSYASKVLYRIPYQKWYISDVGLVPVGSELDRKLDSISDSYKLKFK